MYDISLKALPNQTIKTTINNNEYTLTFRFNQIMLFTLEVNGLVVCENERVFSNQYLLPYKWQEEMAIGNFIFDTNDDEYPMYTNFGTSCNLKFIEKASL